MPQSRVKMTRLQKYKDVKQALSLRHQPIDQTPENHRYDRYKVDSEEQLWKKDDCGGVDDDIDGDGDGEINLDRCDVSGSAVDQTVLHHRLLQP